MIEASVVDSIFYFFFFFSPRSTQRRICWFGVPDDPEDRRERGGEKETQESEVVFIPLVPGEGETIRLCAVPANRFLISTPSAHRRSERFPPQFTAGKLEESKGASLSWLPN